LRKIYRGKEKNSFYANCLLNLIDNSRKKKKGGIKLVGILKLLGLELKFERRGFHTTQFVVLPPLSPLSWEDARSIMEEIRLHHDNDSTNVLVIEQQENEIRSGFTDYLKDRLQDKVVNAMKNPMVIISSPNGRIEIWANPKAAGWQTISQLFIPLEARA